MTKKEELTQKLKLIVNDRKKLEQFILKNSNLPGPRGNIELAFALAEIFDQIDVLFDWLKITEEEADTNNPKAFLPFCAAVCLGKIYTKKKNKKIITVLKKSANDGRWRMREAVAFAFQIIGENNFDELKNIFSEWNNKSNNFEKRAILVSLAHPKFLNEGNAKFCFEIAEVVLKEMNRENNFDVLRKGLEFTISVFAAANPKLGFTFIKRWIGKDKVIDKIMKENLKKDRLVKKNPEEVKKILESI
ncbi:MAG: hypothetical protein HYS25_04020 [Ignavibacteriales bacterium]|nr:hypothetical protein [Ignavibacteriales bacterium]